MDVGVIHDPLFPGAADGAATDDRLTRTLLAAMARVRDGRVAPDPGFRIDLAGFDFAAPMPLDTVMDWTIAQLEAGVTQMTHPRYFGLFNPAPTHPSQCADRIAAAFNPQLASATTAPAATAIEAHVIAAIGRRAGLPGTAAGHFTAGGSEANATALICALTHASLDFASQGARCFDGPPVFYVSRECHLAWIKIAHQAGIGRDAARMVPTDGQGRLCADALRAMIADDRAQGRVPVMVVATAGTTGGGMVDPLAACHAIARESGAWFHVDAAWGGALIASPRHAAALDGIAAADSLTIDAHKWFATTMGCGMFVTRHQALLQQAFTVTASFMPSHAASLDPYMTSMQWSRRFSGLRLFLSLAAAGWDGYARHVDTAIATAATAARLLAAEGWTVVNRSPMAVVCAVPPPGAPGVRTIVQRVVDGGAAWVSVALFEGAEALRVCVTHGQTTDADVATLVAAIGAAIRHAQNGSTTSSSC